MKKHFLFRLFLFGIILILCCNNLLHAQKLDSIRITETFQEQSFESFFNILKDKYDVKVFYKDKWIKPYKISKTFENTPLIQALNSLFVNHELKYLLYQDNAIVVFPRVSDFRAQIVENDQLFIIGDPLNIGRYKNGKLNGKVLDGKTGEPLVGAIVYNTKLQKGSTTNNDGSFVLELPTGDHQLQFSFIGFENSFSSIRLIEDGYQAFELFEESHKIGEITILGENSDLPRAQMSMVQMNSREIKQMPALMGEVDVMKGLAILAGVQTVSELSSGLNVRGGNTDQNLILVNGSPVFNSSHFFGFLSLLNPDVVEDVKLFKGGMPVKFGERVSSVMEVDFKDGNNETVSVYGGIGVINSRLTIDGPLTKNKKLTFILGGRSSYTNWILKKIPELEINQSEANFYDLSGKLTYKFNRHNKISLMGYVSNDEFSTSSNLVTQYGNKLGNLKMNTRFAEQLYGNLDISYSEYEFRLTDYANGTPSESYSLYNMLQYSSLGYHFNWHLHPQHKAEFGFKTVYNKINPGEISPIEEITVIENEMLNDEKVFEWAAYLSDEFEILPEFSVVVGLRYSQFYNFGTNLVYVYDENKPMLPENITGTISFDENQVSKSYGGFEPRFSLNYDIDLNTSLKFNYQRTRQYMFQLSNNAVITPAEIWKAADYHLKPLISDQIAIGVENNSWFRDIEFLTEVYYKNLQNLIEYKNGAQLIMNEHVETALIPTQGYSYGIEFSAKKSFGRLTGYASYVYSRTMRKNNSQFSEEILWKGNYYSSIYDKPHDFSITSTYNISRRWRVSGNFVIISGRPVTLPEIQYKFAGEEVIYYSDRNKYRMPSYNRLDLSITFDENLRKKRMWKGSWTFAIYNVYARNNPYSVYYKKSTPGESNNYQRYSLYRLSVIGAAVPSLTYNFKF